MGGWVGVCVCVLCFGLVLSNVESVIRPEVTVCGLRSVKIQKQTNKQTDKLITLPDCLANGTDLA